MLDLSYMLALDQEISGFTLNHDSLYIWTRTSILRFIFKHEKVKDEADILL